MKKFPLTLISFLLLIIFGVISVFFISQPLPLVLILIPATIFILLLAFLIFPNPLWGVILLFFFLPFERIGALTFGEERAGGLTIRFSQIIAGLTFLAWFLEGIIKRKLALVKNPFFLVTLGYLFIALLSLTNSINFLRSGMVFSFIFFTILVFWLIPNLVRNKNILEKIFLALLIITFITSLFGFYQFFGDLIGLPPNVTGLREIYTKKVFGLPRIHSVALEPLLWANFLLIPIGWGLSQFLIGSSKVPRLFLLSVIGIALINFVLTLSRGGWLGLLVTLIVLITPQLNLILRPKILFLGIILIGIVSISLWAFVNYSDLGAKNWRELTRRITQVYRDASALHRYRNYQAAFRAFDESPLIGIGIGNFGPYVAYHPEVPGKHGWQIVNNQYLEVAAETGVLGLGLLLILWFGILVRSFIAYIKTDDFFLKATLLGLSSAFIGILVQYNFFSTLYIIHIWATLGLLVAVQNMALAKQNV